MQRWLLAISLLLVLAPLGSSVAAQPAGPWRAPDQVTVRWLEPGHVLVRWRQHSDADYLLLGVCLTATITEDTCTVTTALRHRMAGIQTATTWGQPGNAVYVWEYRTVGPNHYTPLGDAIGPLILPPYPTYLPVLR